MSRAPFDNIKNRNVRSGGIKTAPLRTIGRERHPECGCGRPVFDRRLLAHWTCKKCGKLIDQERVWDLAVHGSWG